METIEKYGLRAKITPDEEPQNPREEFENLSTMVCEHRKYKLGDGEFKELVGRPMYDFKYRYDGEDRRQDPFASLVERYVRMKFGAVCFTWLGMYDHSGITVYPCDHDHGGWDSGVIGFAFVGRQEYLAVYGEDTPENRKKALQSMYCEIKTYDQYVRGDVYGVSVETLKGEIVDSLSGIFGMDWAETEAKEMLEHAKGWKESPEGKLKEFETLTRKAIYDLEAAEKLVPPGLWIGEKLRLGIDSLKRTYEDIEAADFEEEQHG